MSRTIPTSKGRNRETTQHISGDNIIVKYDYDAVGQLTTVQHPNDKTTTYEYDLLGHKLKVNPPMQVKWPVHTLKIHKDHIQFLK